MNVSEFVCACVANLEHLTSFEDDKGTYSVSGSGGSVMYFVSAWQQYVMLL